MLCCAALFHCEDGLACKQGLGTLSLAPPTCHRHAQAVTPIPPDLSGGMNGSMLLGCGDVCPPSLPVPFPELGDDVTGNQVRWLAGCVVSPRGGDASCEASLRRRPATRLTRQARGQGWAEGAEHPYAQQGGFGAG
jgi:hypothetical protein